MDGPLGQRVTATPTAGRTSQLPAINGPKFTHGAPTGTNCCHWNAVYEAMVTWCPVLVNRHCFWRGATFVLRRTGTMLSAWGPLLVETRPQRGGGGGSMDPKIVVRNNVLCRRQRRRRFCLRHRAGGNFFVRPYVSELKILRISWRIQKWLKSTKKDFDPDPASGSDLG